MQPPHPSRPLHQQQAQAQVARYTCLMHPEICQDRPGACPKCGLALKPVLPAWDDGDNSSELIDFRRRFWSTLPLTAAVFVLAMFGQRLGWFAMATQSWVEFVLSHPVVLWAGWPFFVRGAQSVLRRSPNVPTLIGPGTGAAFVYSVVATVVPQAFPAAFISKGRVAVYFEASVVIISLTLSGKMLEVKARSQPSAAIKSLPGLAPGASSPTAARRTYRFATCTLATGCACAREKSAG